MTTLTQHGDTFPLYQHPGVEFISRAGGVDGVGYGAKRHTLNNGDTMQIPTAKWPTTTLTSSTSR